MPSSTRNTRYKSTKTSPIYVLFAACLTTSILAAAPTLKVAPAATPAVDAVPATITAELQKLTPQAQKATVAIGLRGNASGVLISPEGHILTAAHVVRKHPKGKTIGVILANGRGVSANVMGVDWGADLALLKIIGDGGWPAVTLAESSPSPGAFCFVVAHPTGFMEKRPAQVRLGRIFNTVQQDGKTFIIRADCNIQPGDSGGPLFDMNGNLIGICSSAAGLIGFNQFGAIDQFHAQKDRLLKGERLGKAETGPSNPMLAGGKISGERMKALQQEFMRRVKMKHRPMMDFVRKNVDKQGRLQVSQKQMIEALGKDGQLIARGQDVVFGMDDPALMKRLPPAPADAIRPIRFRIGSTELLGLPVTPRHLLVKLSEVKKAYKGKTPTLVGINETWDLAVLDSKRNDLTPVDLSPQEPEITPGQGLLSVDYAGRTDWGVATGPTYEVKKGRSKGPLLDKTLVSDHRCPYKRVLPHSIPLFARDACTPVYTFDGKFVGVHVARLNRTMGLIMMVDDLRTVVAEMVQPGQP